MNTFDWNLNELYNGCILAGITHAIMVAKFPSAADEHSWDGKTYCTHDNAGTQGAITFSDKLCVAAFRNNKSERTILKNLKNSLDYFLGAPEKIIELAKTETLQYLLVEAGFGRLVPLITTAFWGDENELLSVDSFDSFLENGGYLLSRQVMDIEDAIDEWEDNYNMNDDQIELLKLLYDRKISNPESTILISKEEAVMIGKPKGKSGMEECILSFKEMDMILEF